MERCSFIHDFSKVLMLRKSSKNCLQHSVISFLEQKSERNQPDDVKQESINRLSDDENQLKLCMNLDVLNVYQSQCMIWVDLVDSLHYIKDCSVNYYLEDKKSHFGQSQSINIVFESMRVIHQQISSQLNENANITTFLSPSEQAEYFKKFIDNLTNRNIVAFFFPFQMIQANKNVKKLVFSKLLFNFLRIGVNQTCVNIKKYGLLALQVFSTNLAQKIISQYKFSLKHYNKAFITNQITRQKLQPISSSIFQDQIKIKRQGSKNIYDILKVDYEIFVPGPGIIIVEVIQKGETSETVSSEREQFEKLKIIYEQKFNENQSLNHIIKLPHSKMIPSNSKMCSYREMSPKK